MGLSKNTIATVAIEYMEHPPVFYSANMDDGDELNKMIFEQHKEVIHYQF